jgi:hypothetical protein
MANVPSTALVRSEIAALRRAIGSDPPARAAARLGIDRHTMLRAVSGYPVRTGTACQIRLALASIDTTVRP